MLNIILGGQMSGSDSSLLLLILSIMVILFIGQKIVPLAKKFIHERFVH